MTPTTTGRVATLCCAVMLALSGCSGEATPVSEASPTPVNEKPTQPRAQLAARAAAAKDVRGVSAYLWKTSGRPDRQMMVTRAADGSWRVDLPGGAHSGTVNISLVSVAKALYQCQPAGCVKVDKSLPAQADPRLHHLFTDWQQALTDRQLPLAVSIADKLPGVDGDCYAVESSAVSIKLPVDAGIYCYKTDGTLTGARLSVGTVTLTGITAAPPTIALPGPIIAGQPLPLIAPPSPTPSISPSAVNR